MKLVTLVFDWLGETEMAVHLSNGDIDVWIPKSQIDKKKSMKYPEADDSIMITIPEWLAIKKELV